MYDYGARFYDPQIGRWTTKEPFAELVPGISLYAYCYDNPVNYTEPSGLWPGWVHKRIIRKALNPYLGHGLTEQQLNEIIAGGAEIDAENQSPADSRMHSMRDGISGQSVSEAMQARDEWVSQNIYDFQKTGEYKYLGYAIHAMSDEHAPTHSWKPWSGLGFSNGFGLFHLVGELNPLGSWSKAFNLSASLVESTYMYATSESSSSPNPAPTPDRTPGPDPVPAPPIPPVTPPSPPPGLIPPTPQPEPPVIINPPLIIPRPNG